MAKWTEVPAGLLNAAQQRFWVALGDDAGTVVNRINTDPDYLGKIISVAQQELKLLEPTGISFKVPAMKKFIAAKKFIVDTSETAHVRISYLGDNFKAWMLPKVETDLPEVEHRLHKLRKKSLDQPIVDELGAQRDVSLYGFYETLAHKQTKGDLSWTIGYVLDFKGGLRAVRARWYGVGWGVGAFSVGIPDPWSAGCEFVSRYSFLSSPRECSWGGVFAIKPLRQPPIILPTSSI